MLEKIKKHKKLTIALVIVLIVAILIGVVVHNVKKTASDMMDMAMGVQAFHLEQQDMSSTVSTSGTVESANVVEVTTEVTSPIKELNVALGDHVEKGQVLCTFDGEEIRQQIADLESQNAAVKKADQSSKQKAQRALEQAQAQANAKAAALAESSVSIRRSAVSWVVRARPESSRHRRWWMHNWLCRRHRASTMRHRAVFRMPRMR